MSLKDDELYAMTQMWRALREFDSSERIRILAWLSHRSLSLRESPSDKSIFSDSTLSIPLNGTIREDH